MRVRPPGWPTETSYSSLRSPIVRHRSLRSLPTPHRKDTVPPDAVVGFSCRLLVSDRQDGLVGR